MKKILVLLSSILLLTSCATSTSKPSIKPTTDTSTEATPYDGVTSATIDLNGLEYTATLTVDDAEKIVLEKEPTAVVTKIKLDEDDKRTIYEIEIYANNNSYDIELDANTGELLKWKIDD